MKIIEAMKMIKELLIKSEDLRTKIANHCSDLDFSTPVYADPKKQVSEWLQAHSDILKEINKLRFQIQKTNIMTNVTIEFNSVQVTKTIAEWIHRRRDLAKYDLEAWSKLGDRNLKEGFLNPTQQGGQQIPIKIIRYFDPVERDNKIDMYRKEPSLIDRTLEVTNAVTDLIQ